MTDEIDYKALCDQYMSENEGLRIRIIKLKNDDTSFFERIRDKITDLVEDERFLLYFYVVMSVFCVVIVPLVKAFIAYIARKKGNNEG